MFNRLRKIFQFIHNNNIIEGKKSFCQNRDVNGKFLLMLDELDGWVGGENDKASKKCIFFKGSSSV